MEQAKVNAMFESMMSSMDVDSAVVEKREPLDHVRRALLSEYSKYINVFGTTDVFDRDYYAQAIEEIENELNSLLFVKGLIKFEDLVSVTGDTIYFTVHDTTRKIYPSRLQNGRYLTGKVAGVTIMDVPKPEFVNLVRSNAQPRLSLTEHNVPLNPVGLGMVFESAFFKKVNGEYQVIPDEVTVIAPLDYPALHLSRVTLE